MTKPSGDLQRRVQDLREKLKSLEKAIHAAYSGSAEHGSFLRRGGGEYVPSVFMTLNHAYELLADLDAVLGVPSEQALADMLVQTTDDTPLGLSWLIYKRNESGPDGLATISSRKLSEIIDEYLALLRGGGPEPQQNQADVRHAWQLTDEVNHVYTCAHCRAWTANRPLYLNEICPSRDRRMGERRRKYDG